MKIRKPKNRFERALVVILLAMLIGAAIVILVRQSFFDIGKYGFVSPGDSAGTGPGAAINIIERDGLAPPSFTPFLNTERYAADALFEKINGKAPMYLEAGFRSLSSRRFARIGDERLWMEVFLYDMGDARNAFSVYSQQKREDARELPSPGYAYESSGAIFMAKGRYYIEIIGSTKSEILATAVRLLSERIAGSIPAAPGDRIAELALFDPASAVPGSEKYYVKSAFGFGGFTNIYTVRYRSRGGAATVFAGKRDSADDAMKTAAGYRRFLEQNGAAIVKGDPKSGMTIADLFNFIEAIAAHGEYIIGVHEAATAAEAERILYALMSRIGAGGGK